MLNNHLHIGLLLWVSITAFGQKSLQKTWSSKSIDTLEINANTIAGVEIKTTVTDKISLETRVEGEYSESVVLDTFQSTGSLRLSVGFSPYHFSFNDKLAAHKVLSVEINLIIPEGMTVLIRSKTGAVMAYGDYKYFEVSLEEGSCNLFDFSGNGQLYTISGDITLRANDQVSALGISKFGSVKNELQQPAEFRVIAESVNGDILLLKR